MEQAMFEWKDDYKIGVKIIDDAHKQLFSIVSRILRNFTEADFERNKMTCIEAIKYLKSYTVQHFAEEEKYQRSIGYSGYVNHKKVHDNMRDVVLPALEREVTQSRYSRESMEHFVGACAGWLAAHVLIEDQAITGKVPSKWKSDTDKESTAMLEELFKTINNGAFQISTTLVSAKYQGYELGKLFCYRDKFKTETEEEYTIVTAMEETLLSNIMTSLLNKKIFELDEVMTPMIKEMFKAFNRDILSAFLPHALVNFNSTVLPERDFYAMFKDVYPDYSMLWRTDNGYIALCINKNKVKPKK
ncbi:MAG: hemerythrin domain-containing protein [Oscillospiraceae bacterium]|nr:hemerythrin domain-containing protein [Oscillospiraceae bacterium]